MHWYGQQGEPDELVRTGWGIWPFWWEEGHLLEGAGWMEDALSVAVSAGAGLLAASSSGPETARND